MKQALYAFGSDDNKAVSF